VAQRRNLKNQMTLALGTGEYANDAISSSAMNKKKKKSLPRGFFSKALMKDTIQILPDLPDTTEIDEIRKYLWKNLKYSAESSRKRYSLYILKRMFPTGRADKPLRDFAYKFAYCQELKDVVFYRFCKAEPLMIDVIYELILPALGKGTISRSSITQYLQSRYPDISRVQDCSKSIVEALSSAGIVSADKQKINFATRKPLYASFAFILHSEFPKTGIYPVKSLLENPFFTGMLWDTEQFLMNLYELRNRGLIAKVSEIDNIRQFTTKYTLDEVVNQLENIGE